jgi:hypothetical protein
LEYKFEREEVERKKNGCKYIPIETGIPCAIRFYPSTKSYEDSNIE